ncbi:MAG TPA: GNAT family N-acetyltransferase [Fimbriimonadaceae bacterium]|nr:GNAT family N-acetyltransferase [Fimbriimonadaceae bacterium]
MRVSFRPADLKDFDYCASLYFAGRAKDLRESDIDMVPLIADLRKRWHVSQVRIITLEGRDVGWLQSTEQDGALFIVQLFIEASSQGQGLGSEVLHRVIEEGRQRNQAVTLGVVKTNPAMRLYARLGFRTTHEDDRKFYMKRDIDPAG